MADTAGAAAMTVDSMSASVTSVGPNGITIRVTGKHLSPQVAAKNGGGGDEGGGYRGDGGDVIYDSATIATVTNISVTEAGTTRPGNGDGCNAKGGGR